MARSSAGRKRVEEPRLLAGLQVQAGFWLRRTGATGQGRRTREAQAPADTKPADQTRRSGVCRRR